MTIRVGLSGWRYPHWRGDFYPRGLVQREELAYAARRFDALELNGSFYSLQTPDRFRRWAEQTPDGFVFAVKGPRFVTHTRRLGGDLEVALGNFFASGVTELGHKLGPVLWQLPPTLRFDTDVVRTFLSALPRTVAEATALARHHDHHVADPVTRARPGTARDPVRHAVEVRHDSFGTDEALALLTSYGVAVVGADTGGRYPQIDAPSAELDYLRLHGPGELYASGYADADLRAWAKRARRSARAGRDVYVFFDIDGSGHAPRDAARLQELLRA